MKIINYDEKEMIPLTKEENNFYNEQEICYISKEKFCIDKDDKNYINKIKIKYTWEFRGAAHSICHLWNVNNNYNNCQ